MVHIDSQLVASQIKGEYKKKDPIITKYLKRMLQKAKGFAKFEVLHVPREKNVRLDLLARLASTKGQRLNRTVI